MRVLPVLSVVVLLGACGDPLANVAKLGDVDVADTDPAAAVLPSSSEVAREGFFGTDGATETVPVAVESETVTPAPEEIGGIFRKLVRRAATANPEAVAAAQAKEEAKAIASAQADAVAAVALEAEPPAQAASNSEPVIIETRPTISASVELAPVPDEKPAPVRGLSSLFGGGGAAEKRNKPRTGPDARDVPFGTVLAFGQIARVCDAKGKSLGTKVDGAGRRGFTLYDSKAGTRDKRTFYITGFSDNCARQFTAANALLGAPTFYEEIRFGPTGQFMTLADTDKAYDKVKSSVCRTSKNKPCGKHIDKLDNSTVFVSAYEFSEINSKWKEFLVHDGEVLASSLK